jgi:hypothetical protein
MDNKAEEEWSGNDEMDVDELEGTLAVGKCKAVEVAEEPTPKRTKDGLPVEMRGAGEITEQYRAWLVANAQPSDIVSFLFGFGFYC